MISAEKERIVVWFPGAPLISILDSESINLRLNNANALPKAIQRVSLSKPTWLIVASIDWLN